MDGEVSVLTIIDKSEGFILAGKTKFWSPENVNFGMFLTA